MSTKDFSTQTTIRPPIAQSVKLNALNRFLDEANNTEKMPVLFLGHGSPMNAIEENEFVDEFRRLGREMEKPSAILVISAHWETRGTFVTAMEHPNTIHDFGGFPQTLFDVHYPAPGSPELAQATKALVTSTTVQLDHKWGLDHGAWSVVKHLYPQANIPVIQMSIDYTQPASYHYALAKELTKLRSKGVLIIGSGNMVHNLRMVSWKHLHESYGYDWAIEANEAMKGFIKDRNHEALINFKRQGRAFDLAIPTPEHYLPLLYSLALQDEKEDIILFNDSPIAGALTMTSVKIG
ncbi:4,5-DOPA-extradiol-dioxygenase [Sphingobacterium paludis]|uniref:4,5-DOPA dioxygenase extradiol n=1 Tax=Sphingobacterium paludis TaxID=1476465 RepID=A0A4R7DB44_9SPHI|nr:4,5-DOPA dioxygenase extradiol [Sphingobacterium paludis]TDS17491.1 4,5-DOPA dioxygenase extradiol [Sphingobacterium paludis]